MKNSLKSTNIACKIINTFTISTLSIMLSQNIARSQNQWSAGFYQAQNSAEVSYVTGNGNYCYVQNPPQLKKFGGWDRVRHVGDSSYKDGLSNSGPCGWPDGLYRLKSQPGVFKLYGSEACWVSSTDQLNKSMGGWSQVFTIDDESSTNLFVNRSYTRKSCPWR
jgi:hypothetical protein